MNAVPENRDPDHEKYRYIPAPTDDDQDVPFTTGLFVDALSRGEPAQDDDDLAACLAAWRDDLTADLTAGLPAPRPAAPRHLAPVHTLTPPRRRRRVFTPAVAAAAAAIVLFTGLAVGSWHSHPASPLWPVARVLYPDYTDTVAIEHTITQARHALNHGHPDQAAQLINAARHQLATAGLPNDTASRLRAQIDDLVLDLVAVLTRQPAAAPSAPAPATTGPPTKTPPSTAAPTPRVTAPAIPKPSRSVVQDGGILPPLPVLPLPTLFPSPTESSDTQPRVPDADLPQIPDVPQLPDLPATEPPPADDQQEGDERPRPNLLPDLHLPIPTGGLLD